MREDFNMNMIFKNIYAEDDKLFKTTILALYICIF
jgi:hypothetical protein